MGFIPQSERSQQERSHTVMFVMGPAQVRAQSGLKYSFNVFVQRKKNQSITDKVGNRNCTCDCSEMTYDEHCMCIKACCVFAVCILL